MRAAHLNGKTCPWGYAMHYPLSKGRLLGNFKRSRATWNVVVTYIDNIVIATETIEDHLEMIREVFEYLTDAGFKMRAENCDSMLMETNNLERVVSGEGIIWDPEDVCKFQDWTSPRKTDVT